MKDLACDRVWVSLSVLRAVLTISAVGSRVWRMSSGVKPITSFRFSRALIWRMGVLGHFCCCRRFSTLAILGMNGVRDWVFLIDDVKALHDGDRARSAVAATASFILRDTWWVKGLKDELGLIEVEAKNYNICDTVKCGIRYPG